MAKNRTLTAAGGIMLIGLAACTLIARASGVVDDTFDGPTLSRSKWADISQYGSVGVAGDLAATTSGSQTFSRAALLTQYRFLGDFDIQVTYRIGGGWSAPIDSAPIGLHTEIALGMYLDDSRYIQIARGKNSGGDGINVYTNIPGQETHNAVWVPTSALTGVHRISRTGSTVTVRYYAGSSWHDLDVIPAFAAPVRVYLSAASVGLARTFTGYFDDFRVNAGATSYREYVRPSAFEARPGLMLGAASTDYLLLRTWGQDWKVADPLEALKQHGMDWLRVGVLTTSSSYLRDTPPDRWNTLPWRTEYWGCREYAEQIMREASGKGMRLMVYLWLSDIASHAGVQHPPPEWAGLGVAQTAARLDTYGYETAKYFKDRGLNVEIYEIGNEIDFGILGFRPNERIPIPPGVDITMNTGWMRDNVWNVEATLLKSAIAGVKRANPEAKIGLHIAGLAVGRTTLFPEAFFQTMVDEQVDFDYAGLSHPSASYPWDLDRYSTDSWFQRLQGLTDFIAALNKQVVFSEGTYPNDPQGQVAAPMQEFPFTPAGQAAWVREQLRFASHNPTVAGWFYWYPDAYPGLNGGDVPPNIPSFGLFASQTQVQPALLEFLANVPQHPADRRSELLWHHTTRGEVWLWPMDGAARTAETFVRTVGDTNFEIRGLGDQNGDGKADTLWRNRVTGQVYFWPMDGATPLGEIFVSTVSTNYDIVGTGDFNGDRKSDILWRNLTNGEVWIWLMDGPTPLSQVYVDRVDPGYVVKGVGDLDGNGKADIVWHNGTSGEVWVWPMNGTTRLDQMWVATVPDVGYRIVGVADFTGDGKADILWHHATRGEVWLWTMNGTTLVGQAYVGMVPDTGYRILGNGDYNGDGKADILWHHATRGEVWVWLMNGAVTLSQNYVATVPDTGYQIVKVK